MNSNITPRTARRSAVPCHAYRYHCGKGLPGSERAMFFYPRHSLSIDGGSSRILFRLLSQKNEKLKINALASTHSSWVRRDINAISRVQNSDRITFFSVFSSADKFYFSLFHYFPSSLSVFFSSCLAPASAVLCAGSSYFFSLRVFSTAFCESFSFCVFGFSFRFFLLLHSAAPFPFFRLSIRHIYEMNSYEFLSVKSEMWTSARRSVCVSILFSVLSLFAAPFKRIFSKRKYMTNREPSTHTPIHAAYLAQMQLVHT